MTYVPPRALGDTEALSLLTITPEQLKLGYAKKGLLGRVPFAVVASMPDGNYVVVDPQKATVIHHG